MQLNLNILLVQLMRNHILRQIPSNQINKSMKELQELKDNSRKSIPESIKPSLNNYKKTAKRELKKPQEEKNFSRLKLEKLNA
jgi:hypothetical protein